jgi:hypothetical protein
MANFSKCSHCDRGLRQSEIDGQILIDPGNDQTGFFYKVNSVGNHIIMCPCGIMTRPCNTLQSLQEVWNSRPGAKVKQETVSVKHPPVRGIDPF